MIIVESNNMPNLFVIAAITVTEANAPNVIYRVKLVRVPEEINA